VQSNISQSLFAGLKQGDDRLSVFLPGFGLVEECPAHPGARIFKRAADILLPMSKPPIVNNYRLTSGGVGHGVPPSDDDPDWRSELCGNLQRKSSGISRPRHDNPDVAADVSRLQSVSVFCLFSVRAS
jgi:hypothetical protein